MNDFKAALAYTRKHIDIDSVHRAIDEMNEKREPLSSVNPQLFDDIHDYMEEYSMDHDLPEGWWYYEMDEEDIIFEL